MGERATDERAPRWADWWARVATVAERRETKRVTQACVDELFPGWLACCEREEGWLPRQSAADEWRTYIQPSNPRAARSVIAGALRVARDVLLSLVNREGGTPHVVFLPRLRAGRGIYVRNRVVREGGKMSGGDHHVAALHALLTPGRAFLFARCPVCHVIFARSGRGKRCSVRCTRSVVEKKRSGTPERRAQAREAMRRLRAKRAAETKGAS